MFQPNTEQAYPHFFHLLSPDKIVGVKVVGEVTISYIGFGNQGRPYHLPQHYLLLLNIRPAACPTSGIQPHLHVSRGPGLQP